nr:ATP-binding cassette transporter Abcc1-7 [Brachionus angularis]
MERELKSICGSELWNPNAVYSDYPDFTFCFQYTLLIWIPCLFLWLAAPLWIYKHTKTGPYKINYSWLIITKTISTIFLITIEIFNLIIAFNKQNLPVFYITPIILITSYILIIFFMHFERSNGYKYSTLGFIYWFLMFLVSLITLRSKLLFQINKNDFRKSKEELFKFKLIDYDLYSFYLSFCFTLLNTILFSLSEKVKTEKNIILDKTPEETCSVLSKLTFWWINPLINTGYKRDLVREDLWQMQDKEKCVACTKRIEDSWLPIAKEYIIKVRNIEEVKYSSKTVNYESKNDEETIKLNINQNDAEKEIKNLKQPSLGLCMFKTFVFKFIGVISIKCVHDLLNFARPILLDKLITFVKDKDQKLSVGLFYIFLLSLSSLSQTLIMQHYYHGIFIVGNRMKIGLMNLIFKKSLRLSPSARKSTTVGEMTTIITSNAQTFEGCVYHLNGLISTPLQIFISTYMLYKYLGYATFVGLASMIIFLPANAFFAKRSKKIKREKYKLQDSRIKMMNEILSGIRVIKFYGWEVSFEKIIEKIRKNEITNLIKTALLSTLSGLTWQCAPFVVAAVSFTTFILIDEKNNLDPNTTFVSLTLFSMLRFPLNFLPYIIQGLIQLNVSLTRIREFLLKDEIKEDEISHEDIPGYALNLDNVNFGWSKTEPILRDLNLNVKKGELVAIVGKVGAGKSSFLSALLGEMHKTNNGKINVNGSTAYVPQQAWIQNATIKNNILFNLLYEENSYNNIIESCALTPDLKILPSGDKTEIGERGINLSGGQKQRISLARSLYANADIYMLDDPLSAVDSHVGKHIFDKAIGPNGMLKDKTRFLVTNSLSFLPQCDKIVMLENGSITEVGTYKELQEKNSGFSEFMRSFLEVKEASQVYIIIYSFNIKLFYQILKYSNLSQLEENENNIEIKPDNTAKNEIESNESAKKTTKTEKLIEKEKIQSGNVKFSVVLEYFKACRLSLSFLFFFLFLLSYASDMSSNYWLTEWSNEANLEPSARKSKFFRLGIYSLLGFSKSFISFLANVCFVGMFIKATKSLHERLLDSVLKGNLRFFETTPIGRIVNRFTKDVEATEDSIPYSIKSLIDCFLGMLSTIIIISSSTPFFLIALIPITVFYIFVQRYFVPSNRQLKRMQSASKSPIFSHFSECQAGVSTVRAYGAQGRFIKIMENNIDENLVYYYCNTASNRWLALRLEIIGNLITILAAFFAIINRDNLSAGLAGLSISISLTISNNLNWFVRTISEFEANITSVERIIEYFDIKHEAPWSIEEAKPSTTWPENGNITFSNYSVKYRQDLDWVLNSLNINIKPGEKIGIVGRTGAGKSSLTLGLFRMLEYYDGNISIDEINIKKIGLHDLRHKLTIIPQDSVIFSGTIRMNLDPFEMYSDQEIWSALELSHLKEFVSGLDKKLYFECSEGGDNLSAGQRQLLCLARALLRKTKILILDEATASVDHNTDELIQNTIRSEFKNCTILTIAHRLNTIMDSSRIMVLEKGKVVEFDSPKALLSNTTSYFYSMAHTAGLI